MIAAAAAPEALADPDLHATGDPHALWGWLRANSPVHRHPEGELPAFWSLTKYDDVRAVYRDPATFSSARGVLLRPVTQHADPGGGMTLALTDPPRHKRLRSLVAGWFTERSARGLEESIRGAVRATLARAYERGECDFVHDIAGRLSIFVICGMLGVPESDHELVFAWTNEAYAAHKPLVAQHELMEYFSDLMYRRMEEPADDMISALANGMLDGELLTEREILLNCENLIGATENGRLAIAGGVLALARHPDQWARLRAEPALVPSAVEEILRWTSSATHSMRSATRDTEIRGQRIAAGDWVVLWVPSANRDEDVFADPYRFDIARTPNRHLALGIGEHFCLGATIARTQMRVLLTELLADLDAIELAGPVEMVRSIAVGGPETLPLRMVPR
ncbi:cytochrome P450 [Actinokineospora sp. NPDC004072]